MTEHALQTLCVRWFRGHYPDLLIFAIPNGGARSKTTGAMLKEEGVQAGIPDLCVPIPRGSYHGLWVEMKTEKGVVRSSQKAMMKKLTDQGYQCSVCRSFNEFMSITKSYLNGEEIKTGSYNMVATDDDDNITTLRRMLKH